MATILAGLGLDDVTIAAALLHDAVEDTGVGLDRDRGRVRPGGGGHRRRRHQAGPGPLRLPQAQQAATMRKMLVAMAKDPRVLLIKLADRLHNMQTIAAMPEWKQKRSAQETLDIYAPLAHRFGIQDIKWQLEDLAFAALHPRRYAEIEQMVATRAPERDIYLAQVIDQVNERLAAARIEAQVTGRPKHLYSIYEKMVVKGKEFDEIYDLVGVRVLVDSVKDCWAALGAIHGAWTPVQGRFKDYINTPKFNLYQSLHTTVVGPQGKPLEAQIRTLEMHNRAERGIAAHWGYKEKASAADVAWLQRIVDWSAESTDPAEFLEALKLDLETDEVFVFTPKGDVITLPVHATPDRLRLRHPHRGRATAASGPGSTGGWCRSTPQLASGDSVEIFTSKVPSAGPSRDWLKIVVSPRARNKIRQWFSRERREDAIESGREELTKALRKEGLPVQKLANSPVLVRRRRGDQLRRPRRPARRHRREPRVGPVHRPAGRPGAARRRARGPAADHGPPTAPGQPAPGGRRPRRGPRRRHGPPVALLHPGARRRDHRFRDPRPRRQRAPQRLRQRRHPVRRRSRPHDRGGVGPRQHRQLRGRRRAQGPRPHPPRASTSGR